MTFTAECELCGTPFTSATEEVAEADLLDHQIQQSHFLLLPGKRQRRPKRRIDDYGAEGGPRKRARGESSSEGEGAPVAAAAAAESVMSEDESDTESFNEDEDIDLSAVCAVDAEASDDPGEESEPSDVWQLPPAHAAQLSRAVAEATTKQVGEATAKNQKARWRQAAADAVLTERLPTGFFERQGIRDFLEEICGKFDPPPRQTVRSLIVKRSSDVRIRFSSVLSTFAALPSVAVDTWSDRRVRGFMGAHVTFVIMEPEPLLVTGTLGFKHAPGKHDGASMATLLQQLADDAFPLAADGAGDFLSRAHLVTDGRSAHATMAKALNVSRPLWCMVHRASLFVKDVVKAIKPYATTVGLAGSLVESLKNASALSFTTTPLQAMSKTRYFTALHTVSSVLENRSSLEGLLRGRRLPAKAAAIVAALDWDVMEEMVSVFTPFLSLLPNLSAGGSAYLAIPGVSFTFVQFRRTVAKLQRKLDRASGQHMESIKSCMDRHSSVMSLFDARVGDVFEDEKLLVAYSLSGLFNLTAVLGDSHRVSLATDALKKAFKAVARDSKRVSPSLVRAAAREARRVPVMRREKTQSSTSHLGVLFDLITRQHVESYVDSPSSLSDEPLTDREIDAAFHREIESLSAFRVTVGSRPRKHQVGPQPTQFSFYSVSNRKKCPVLTSMATEYLAMNASSTLSAPGRTVSTQMTGLTAETLEALLSSEGNLNLLSDLLGDEWRKEGLLSAPEPAAVVSVARSVS
jgi:hypothetical protein